MYDEKPTFGRSNTSKRYTGRAETGRTATSILGSLWSYVRPSPRIRKSSSSDESIRSGRSEFSYNYPEKPTLASLRPTRTSRKLRKPVTESKRSGNKFTWGGLFNRKSKPATTSRRSPKASTRSWYQPITSVASTVHAGLQSGWGWVSQAHKRDPEATRLSKRRRSHRGSRPHGGRRSRTCPSDETSITIGPRPPGSDETLRPEHEEFYGGSHTEKTDRKEHQDEVPEDEEVVVVTQEEEGQRSWLRRTGDWLSRTGKGGFRWEGTSKLTRTKRSSDTHHSSETRQNPSLPSIFTLGTAAQSAVRGHLEEKVSLKSFLDPRQDLPLPGGSVVMVDTKSRRMVTGPTMSAKEWRDTEMRGMNSSGYVPVWVNRLSEAGKSRASKMISRLQSTLSGQPRSSSSTDPSRSAGFARTDFTIPNSPIPQSNASERDVLDLIMRSFQMTGLDKELSDVYTSLRSLRACEEQDDNEDILDTARWDLARTVLNDPTCLIRMSQISPDSTAPLDDKSNMIQYLVKFSQGIERELVNVDDYPAEKEYLGY